MIVKPEHPEELYARLVNKPLVLYGFGGAGIRIGAWCDENRIDYVFADQVAEQKQAMTDKKVLLPEDLPKEYPDANIVVTSIVYYNEIVERLLKFGIAKENIISYRVFMPGVVRWKDLEHSTEWGMHEGRVKLIAGLIPCNIKSVADYGEGKRSIKKYLCPSVRYYPVDYIKRSDATILCDFDKDELPDLRTDVSICTATLVFIEKIERLIRHLCVHTAHFVVISYVTTDIFSDIDGRRASGYVNDYSEREVINRFQENGFALKNKCADPANKLDTIYVFSK